MGFSFDTILSLLDQTLLNPWVTILVPASLHLFTAHCFSFVRTDDSAILLPFKLLHPLPKPLYQSLLLLGLGVFLRLNRLLSRRALNNGVSAKFDWGKEVIVVTGAAGGVGAATAQKLASRGSQVVAVDVLPLTYEPPRNLHHYHCDLMDYDAVQAVAAKISKEIGEPTCIVANAGILRGKPILEATKREIELTFGVNSLGVLWTAKAFLPAMAKANHGHFVIVSSQAAHLTTANVVDYSASKAASYSIYEGLQTEMKHVYKAPAVRISVIMPSSVETKMVVGSKAPRNFFAPWLTPQGLGDTIAGVLWSGRAQNVLTPAFAYVALPVRILPDWMRVRMQDDSVHIMSELKPHRPLD